MNEVPEEALTNIERKVHDKLKKSREKDELQQRLLEKSEQTHQNLMSQLQEKNAEVSSLKYELDRLKNEVAKLKQTNETCASLKEQLQETKAQLLEQNEISQAKELEIFSLKEEMKKSAATNWKFKKSSSILDGILSYQRSPHVNTRLGYEITEDFKLPEKKTKKNSRSYADILKSLKYGEESKKEDTQTQQNKKVSPDQGQPRRTILQKGQCVPRYEKAFYGYFYSINEF